MKLELQAPSLPRRRKMPSRYFVGGAQPEHHSNVEDFYCQIYLETVNTVANCIVEHFNQKDCTMYATCEQVLLKGTWGNLSHKMSTNCVSSTRSLTLIPYKFSYLYWQSPITVSDNVKGMGDTVHNVIDFLKKNKKIWPLIPEVMSLAKIILVIQATNGSSECAFSALRRMKSYLRTTMSNNHFNHNMTCTIHTELVKELNLKKSPMTLWIE